MKKINCPLCKKVDAILQEDYSQKTVTSPAIVGTMGNSALTIVGGNWDYSHAESCLSLLGVKDKEGLLRFFNNDVEFWHEDSKSIEDYNSLLLREQLIVEPIVQRMSGNWVFSICIKEVGAFGRTFGETRGSNLDDAFAKLKHRLLCGEIIYFDRNKRFQFSQQEDRLSICKLFY